MKKSCLSDDEKHNDTIYLFKAEQPGFKMLTLKGGLVVSLKVRTVVI